MPIWLNAHEIEALLTMEEAIAAVEEAFRLLALDSVIMPQRLGIGLAQYAGGGAVRGRDPLPCARRCEHRGHLWRREDDR